VEPEEFTNGVAELNHVLYREVRHKVKDVTSAEITILSSHMASLQE
jgi:hypothetical protein